MRIDLTEELVVLYGDRTRLVEVFENLVDNAAKFMGDEPAPRVEIGVEQAGEELVLFVRDNGIVPQLQPVLFGLFYKLDPGTEGIGLVRRIVEVHGAAGSLGGVGRDRHGRNVPVHPGEDETQAGRGGAAETSRRRRMVRAARPCAAPW